MYSRDEFLRNNPDKKVLNCSGRIFHGYGTSKYIIEWLGNWTPKELIDYCDNSTSNFGGCIEDMYITEKGTNKGVVCVYYD